MGELHLDIYVERIRREYKVESRSCFDPTKITEMEAISKYQYFIG